MTITLYDIASTLPGVSASVNTLKARMALNYKQLPFETEWFEFPDIEALCKKIGAAPTSKKPDGSDHYTLPVIRDSATGRVIADSFAIAEYLDATYPDAPALFPPGGRAATALLEASVVRLVATPLFPLLQPSAATFMTPRSAEYYRTKDHGWILPVQPAPDREEVWAKAKEGLTFLAEIYDKNGPGVLLFFGDTFSYADIVVAAFLTAPKRVLGAEHQDVETLAKLDDGRWGKIIQTGQKYTK